MARQNVGNPKFYVDYISYWMHSGMIKGAGIYTSGTLDDDNTVVGSDGYRPELIGLNPSEYIFEEVDLPVTYRFYLTNQVYIPNGANDKFFTSILGHNLFSALVNDVVLEFKSTAQGYNTVMQIGGVAGQSNFTQVCNWYDASDDRFDWNGWSMAEWQGGDSELFDIIDLTLSSPSHVFTFPHILGSINFGTIYEMPHSPDLSLKVTREYKGIKRQNTRGGSTLTQIDYSTAPDWAGFTPWELTRENVGNYIGQGYKEKRSPKRGRRVWDLQFSYVGGDDLFNVNELLANANPTDSAQSEGYNDSDFYGTSEIKFYNNVQTSSDSFIGRLLEKTMGGAIPFIFQPDGNNPSPDQFAICILDQDSFQFEQVAYNVYNISLKIREVW